MSSKTDKAKYIMYLWPNMYFEQPGLGHMKEIARTLITESYAYRRIAILPPLIPNKMHNPKYKVPLRWFEYFDWSDFDTRDLELDNKIKLLEFIKSFDNVRILIDDNEPNISFYKDELIIRLFKTQNIWGEWIKNREEINSKLLEPTFSENYPKKIWDQATSIIQEFGSFRGVMHIRRGDLAGKETDPEQIFKYLESKNAEKNDCIFVLTNENDSNYYQILKSNYPRMIFEKDIKELKLIDNYKIFRICKCIQSRTDMLNLGTLRFMKTVTQVSIYRRILTRIDNKFINLINKNNLITLELIEKAISKNKNNINDNIIKFD